MIDRELLELAAKAAGVYDEWPEPDYGVQWNGEGLWCFGQGEGYLWDPLTDDGDALRLAVKLKITPHIDSNLTDCEDCTETHGADPYAATRRAIVRAAAEIGKGMK